MRDNSFIKWDNLVNIPYSLCRVVINKEQQSIDMYLGEELVFTDYNHVGHYYAHAIRLFDTIKDKRSKWVNLENLWTLRNCIRENYNHGLELEELIWGNGINRMIPKVTPLTKKRFDAIVKAVIEADPYATI